MALPRGSTASTVAPDEKIVQVLKSKVKKTDEIQILLSALFFNKNLNKVFTIKEVDSLQDNKKDGENKNQVAFNLELKKKKNSEFNELLVIINKKEKRIIKISYKDDVENLTELFLNKTSFQNTFSKNLFKFSPPKGVEVTEI